MSLAVFLSIMFQYPPTHEANGNTSSTSYGKRFRYVGDSVQKEIERLHQERVSRIYAQDSTLQVQSHQISALIR